MHSDTDVIKAALPKTHSLLHVPRSPGAKERGGGVALIYPLSLSNIKHIPGNHEVASFEFMEVAISILHQTLRIVVVYRPGHAGTDRVFLEEFGSFVEHFPVKMENF